MIIKEKRERREEDPREECYGREMKREESVRVRESEGRGEEKK